MPAFRITPQDLLFFRDARPMTANQGSGGHGAHWPAPSVLFDALHAALWRAYPAEQDWEHRHCWGRGRDRDHDRNRGQRFGSLVTAGPFPCVGDQWHFPCPSDVSRVKAGDLAATLAVIDDGCGKSDLGAPWLRPLCSTVLATEDKPSPWWSKAAIEAYLRRDPIPGGALRGDEKFYKAEWSTGIAIDEESGAKRPRHLFRRVSAVGKRRVLRPSCQSAAQEADGEEGIGRLLDGRDCRIIVGGQRRACAVAELGTSLNELLPVGTQITGRFLKWLLLSPAVFPEIPEDPANGIAAHPGGWLPTWIDPQDGRVKLRRSPGSRPLGTSRAAWRKEINAQDFIAARLVAASVGKPLVLTGWSDYLQQERGHEHDRRQGARATRLAVPAGSVFHFECDDENAARDLAAALNWHGTSAGSEIVNRRSTLFGEKGFGLGVCGKSCSH